ncbi:hypothetical protein JCM10135_10050 [Stetteria hydrogenophila]
MASTLTALLASILSFVAARVKGGSTYVLGGVAWILVMLVNMRVTLGLGRRREPRRRAESTS